MIRGFSTWVVLLCLSFAAACGGTSSNFVGTRGAGADGAQAAGASGSSSSGGTSSGGGVFGGVVTAEPSTGGAAMESDTKVLTIPKCIRDLFVECPLEGFCVRASTGDDTRSCYRSGVQATWLPSPVFGCNSGELRVFRPDGTLCYSSVAQVVGCEISGYSWYDARGALVASGSVGTTGGALGSFSLQCTGSGALTCTQSSRADCSWGGWPAPPSCELGACGDDGGTGAVRDSGTWD